MILETIFYWLNNTKGFMEDFELKTLLKDYYDIENEIDLDLLKQLNETIESGDFEKFKNILGGVIND